MAATNMNLTGIARKLVHDKHLDEAAAIEAVEAANKESIQLTSYLVKNQMVDYTAVTKRSKLSICSRSIESAIHALERTGF